MRADKKTLLSEAGIRNFERTSARVEYTLLGGIVSLYVAAALFDVLAKTHWAV